MKSAPLTKSTFEAVLEVVVNKFNGFTPAKLHGYSATAFEADVAKILLDNLTQYSQLADIEYKPGSTMFPDICFGSFGVEVKTTESDKWECAGNSILEGTRRDSIDHIYVIFLKKGGKPGVRWANYESTVSDIKVTHSPRYYVNLDADQSIFKKVGTTYGNFKSLPTRDKIALLKRYYKSKNQESWWIDPEEGEQTTSFELTEWGDLPQHVKKSLKIECYSLFPEVLKPEGGDFAGVSAYLMLRHNCLNRNVRDIFTAGGRKTVSISGNSYDLSRACFNLYELRHEIKRYVKQHPTEVATHLGISAQKDVLKAWEAILAKIHVEIQSTNGKHSINLLDLLNTP